MVLKPGMDLAVIGDDQLWIYQPRIRHPEGSSAGFTMSRRHFDERNQLLKSKMSAWLPHPKPKVFLHIACGSKSRSKAEAPQGTAHAGMLASLKKREWIVMGGG